MMSSPFHGQEAALQPVAHDQAAPKRKGKGPAGPVLGKGTAVVRAMVDAAAAEGTAVSQIVDRQACHYTLTKSALTQLCNRQCTGAHDW
jgi:hypothetical protein